MLRSLHLVVWVHQAEVPDSAAQVSTSCWACKRLPSIQKVSVSSLSHSCLCYLQLQQQNLSCKVIGSQRTHQLRSSPATNHQTQTCTSRHICQLRKAHHNHRPSALPSSSAMMGRRLKQMAAKEAGHSEAEPDEVARPPSHCRRVREQLKHQIVQRSLSTPPALAAW